MTPRLAVLHCTPPTTVRDHDTSPMHDASHSRKEPGYCGPSRQRSCSLPDAIHGCPLTTTAGRVGHLLTSAIPCHRTTTPGQPTTLHVDHSAAASPHRHRWWNIHAHRRHRALSSGRGCPGHCAAVTRKRIISILLITSPAVASSARPPTYRGSVDVFNSSSSPPPTVAPSTSSTLYTSQVLLNRGGAHRSTVRPIIFVFIIYFLS